MFAALYAPALPAAAIVDVARAFTPRFEAVGPLVLLDASGLSRLFGSAQELGEHLRDALVKAGGMPRVALASTQTTAALLALGRPGLTVVAASLDASALAPLGVAVLDSYERALVPAFTPAPPPAAARAAATPGDQPGGWHHPRHTHQATRPKRRAEENRQLAILTAWGIRTLGALAALPGPDVFERLGDRGLQWQALARGEEARPLVPWVDEVPFELALELEWPIEGLEPLSFVLARLLEPLSERLERADRGAAQIHTSLRLTTKAVFTRTLPLPAPMRDPKTLRTLILLDLESHPPDAPIDTVRVFIEPTPARVLQWTLLERAQPAPEQVSTLLARLGALMGEGHVGAARLVESWKPGAFAMTRFEIPDQQPPSGERAKRTAAPPDASPASGPELGSALRRFRFPVPARVQVQEGRPIRVVTDRPGFASGAIAEAAGPWRTSGEWWEEGQSWDRDEWDVAMRDGTIYRLVVERSVGQWFLDGLID
jgi:protein ImuB